MLLGAWSPPPSHVPAALCLNHAAYPARLLQQLRGSRSPNVCLNHAAYPARPLLQRHTCNQESLSARQRCIHVSARSLEHAVGPIGTSSETQGIWKSHHPLAKQSCCISRTAPAAGERGSRSPKVCSNHAAYPARPLLQCHTICKQELDLMPGSAAFMCRPEALSTRWGP